LSAVCNEKLNTPYITTANKIISSFNNSTTATSNKSSNNLLINMERSDEIKIKNWKTIYDNVNKDDPSYDPFELSETFLDNTVIENKEKNKTTQNQSISENEIKQTEKVSFNAIIDKFSLNEQQQKAFLLFVGSVFNEEEDQKLIYMTGEGGTGKSRVIMAIRDYFESNGAKNKLLISAPTVRIFSRIFF
jgi:DNA replication protein DnaC